MLRWVGPGSAAGDEGDHDVGGVTVGAIQPASVGGVDLGSANVLGWVRADAPVDLREPVEATDRGESTVIVDAASPRSSIQAWNSSMCARLASMAATPWSVAHWKKPPRRSWRYASSVRPL